MTRRMIAVCQKYSLEELVRLDDKDMVRLLEYYKDGVVPPYNEIRDEAAYIFDGSFGWHC